MPVPVLNTANTGDAYTDALTVVFQAPRSGFSLNVFNNAIMYQLAYTNPFNARDLQWEQMEHNLAPSLSSFNDPAREGLPANCRFAGVRVRSALPGNSGVVTVA